MPPEFSRPEVLEILRDYYAGLDAHENVEIGCPAISRGDKTHARNNSKPGTIVSR